MHALDTCYWHQSLQLILLVRSECSGVNTMATDALTPFVSIPETSASMWQACPCITWWGIVVTRSFYSQCRKMIKNRNIHLLLSETFWRTKDWHVIYCWPLYHPRSKSYGVVFAPWILEILIITDTLCEGNPSMTDRFPSQCASVMANIGPFQKREIKALSPTECNTSGRRRNM